MPRFYAKICLLETYQHHLASGTGDQDAARAALAEFGDIEMVAGEFTRQAPGRRAARLLLATGPVAGLCTRAPRRKPQKPQGPLRGAGADAGAGVLLG